MTCFILTSITCYNRRAIICVQALLEALVNVEVRPSTETRNGKEQCHGMHVEIFFLR